MQPLDSLVAQFVHSLQNQAHVLGRPFTTLLNGLLTTREPKFDATDSARFWSTDKTLLTISSERGPLCFENYEIDSMTGFVPCSPPVTQLPCAFARWEQALASASSCLSLADDDSPHAAQRRQSSLQWRTDLENSPVLDTTPLEEDPNLLRRAHHVLAFLVHFYVHSCPPDPLNPSQILIPASLAVPLVRISKLLAIAPVLTFADTVLWNHEIIDPSSPLTRSNIRPLTLFTGSSDEANFYGCCAEIELRGVEALRAIANFYEIFSTKEDSNDDQFLDQAQLCLDTVAGVIQDLTTILTSVRQICDPQAFYFAVRPWFRGSDAAGPATSASSSSSQSSSSSNRRTWIYQGVDENEILELSGPSAGQSSIIHTLDIFLDIDHSNSPETTVLAPFVSAHAKQSRAPQIGPIPAGSPSSNKPLPNGEFMSRMRRYMPGSHSSFLEQLTKYTHEQAGKNSIRNIVIRHPERLMEPYNQAVLALKQFRDAHIRIACLYVVTMSRKCPSSSNHNSTNVSGMGSMCPAMRPRLSEPVRGTGGNELSLLLKSCRDATTRTLLHNNSA